MLKHRKGSKGGSGAPFLFNNARPHIMGGWVGKLKLGLRGPGFFCACTEGKMWGN